MAKKRELIERLKEKRTALISRTVTRGLPPIAARAAGLPENPPLKPSGIEWLREIPAHWKASKVRHYVSILSGFAFPSAGFTRDNSDMRLLRGVNVGVSKIRWDDTVSWSRMPGDGLNTFELKEGALSQVEAALEKNLGHRMAICKVGYGGGPLEDCPKSVEHARYGSFCDDLQQIFHAARLEFPEDVVIQKKAAGTKDVSPEAMKAYPGVLKTSCV